jgi:hypothetical protein
LHQHGFLGTTALCLGVSFLASVPLAAQVLPVQSNDVAVDVYKLDRPEYTPPGFFIGSYHITSSLPPSLPGNGLNPLQPAAWLPMYDPMVSQTVAYDDNIFARERYHTEDMVNTTTEALNFDHTWSGNLLTGGLYAAQQNYYVHPSENADAYEADVAGNVALTQDGRFGYTGVFTRQPQLRAGLQSDSNLGFRPEYNEAQLIGSYTQDFNHLTVEVQYTWDKTAYNNHIEFGRNVLEQDYSSYIAYHINETTALFVRPALQDLHFLINPQLTNSENLGITGGVRYVSPGFLKFDLLLGMQQHSFSNPAFSNLYQPQISAFVLYNINELNSIDFTAGNVVNPLVRYCGVAGSTNCVVGPAQEVGAGPLVLAGGPNVYIATTIGITYQHEFYHDLLGELRFAYERDQFRGVRPYLVQDNYNPLANARYLVSKNVEIDLTYNYTKRTANFPHVNFYNSGPFNESVLSLTLKAGL